MWVVSVVDVVVELRQFVSSMGFAGCETGLPEGWFGNVDMSGMVGFADEMDVAVVLDGLQVVLPVVQDIGLFS